MKHLHRQILRALPGPFFGWLGMLMFLLLMQFLIKYLPDIVGKGLPLGVIVELIAYNLAYMVVLAVPMSVLIAALFTFARLSETNTYLVIKSSGISVAQLIWPALAAGGLLTAGMWYFNSDVLPEANFRARNLWQDIQRKRPDFELQPGVFYNGLNGYSILVQGSVSGVLQDVLVYDYTDGSNSRAEIKAQRGRVLPLASGALIDLVLEEGEIHRLNPQGGPMAADRYERLAFDQLRFRLDLTDFSFERTDPRDGYRSDRTMRTADLVHSADSIQQVIDAEQARVRTLALGLARDTARARQVPDQPPLLPTPVVERGGATPVRRASLVGLDSTEQQEVIAEAVQTADQAKRQIEDAARTIEWERNRVDRYWVEIHKKRSIALACLIFMLIGAPLGLTIRKGSLGKAGALAIGIFLFYWVTLVQGEKLADRGLLTPWVGMWLANIAMALLGLWLMLYITLDLGATPPLRKRLWEKVRGGRSERLEAGSNGGVEVHKPMHSNTV